jgi:anti-anti-sigma factor
MSLERKLSTNGQQLTVFVKDKFDFSQVQDFRLAYATDIDDVTSIVVDLQQTDYMDSSALGMLLNMQKTMTGKVTSFKIVNCRPQVMKILKIARFDKKFNIS